MNRRRIAIFLMLLLFAGCATTKHDYGTVKTVIVQEEINELDREPVPGTQSDVWVEPMPEYVKVPPQIDRKGVYYRKGHNTIIEPMPEKYQLLELPDGDGNYINPANK